MTGLFRRARAIRTRLDLLGDEMGTDDFVLEIPEDERQSVLHGIDTMLRDDRVQLDDVDTIVGPARRSLLPLILNLGALAVLGIGGLVMFRFFDRSESSMVTADATVQSTEGRILNRLRREAEAELNAKDREIAGFRAALSDLERQRDAVNAEADQRLAELEAEIRSNLEGELAAERSRLSNEGLTGSALRDALAAYEAETAVRFENELTAARDQAAEEAARRLDELEEQRLGYELRIAEADAERDRLQGELEDRNAELEALVRDQQARTDTVSRQLEELRNRREQERLVTDQIAALYARIGGARSRGDFDAAQTALESLESYLREDGIRNLDVVAERAPTDAFLIDALGRLIALESESSGATPAVQDETPLLLERLAAGAAAGTELYRAGDLAEANQTWEEAFSAVPELQDAFTALAAGAAVGGAVGAGAGTAAATEAELAAARQAGRIEGEALGRAAARDAAAADLADARTEGFEQGRAAAQEEFAERIDALTDRLDGLGGRLAAQRDRYADRLARAREDEAAFNRRLAGLLDTKLALKEGLAPRLHDSLETYTEATGDLREIEGREEVYAEIIGFLTALAGEASADGTPAESPTAAR